MHLEKWHGQGCFYQTDCLAHLANFNLISIRNPFLLQVHRQNRDLAANTDANFRKMAKLLIVSSSFPTDFDNFGKNSEVSEILKTSELEKRRNLIHYSHIYHQSQLRKSTPGHSHVKTSSNGTHAGINQSSAAFHDRVVLRRLHDHPVFCVSAHS